MRLPSTPEMEQLHDKIEPYLNEHHELRDDAPKEIRHAFEEYRRLGQERWERAYNL